MESVVSLIIFGVIYFFVHIIKKAFGDAAPAEDVDLPEDDEAPLYEEEYPAPEVVEAPKRKVPKKNVRKASKEATRTTASVPVPPEPNNEKKEHIRIDSRSEAKRAFIYSEIFNRKY